MSVDYNRDMQKDRLSPKRAQSAVIEVRECPQGLFFVAVVEREEIVGQSEMVQRERKR